jgi:adenylate cyclase
MAQRSRGIRIVGALLAAAAAMAWGGFIAHGHLTGRASVIDRLEAPLVDLRLLIAGARDPPDDVVIVGLDDETYSRAGQFPLPRAWVASLVDAIARTGPKVVAVDVLFVDSGEARDDSALATSLTAAPVVLAAAAMFSRGEDREDDSLLPVAERLLLPIPVLRNVASYGVVNIATDQAGTPRHLPLLVRSGNDLVPSFAVSVVSVARGTSAVFAGDSVQIGTTMSRLDLGLSLPLRFYGPRGTFRTISAARVLRGEEDAALAGRIVVVGATALGTGDTFSTPFDPIMPGTEVMATAISHLLTDDGLVRSPTTRQIDAVMALLLPPLAVLLITLRRIGIGLALLTGIVGLWATVAIGAFMGGVWLGMTPVLAALVPPVLLCTIVRLWRDRTRERSLEVARDALSRFQHPALAQRIATTPDFLDKPIPQNAAIMFIDLSRFTGLSERLGPDATRELLKSFHTQVETTVDDHRGVVLSFMGDGAMILFGLPAPEPDDAARALACAQALITRTRQWIAAAIGSDLTIDVRVGVHFGRVVLSRLGPTQHQHITATGDCVNVTSRLLEVAKSHRAALCCSESLFVAAGCPEIGLGPPHETAIRGRTQPLTVRFGEIRGDEPGSSATARNPIASDSKG